MTTTTSANGTARLGLGLARHLRTIVKLDAVLTTVAGLEMLLVPAFFIRVHGLGSTPELAVRVIGVEWLLFGLWLLSLWNRPFTRGMAATAIGILGANAAGLILAPIVFDLGYSTTGWAVTVLVVAFMDLVALAWWQVIAGPASRSNGEPLAAD